VPDQAAPVIDPCGVFTLQQARELLGLAETTLPRECRRGRLRHAKRAGRIFILGEWLIEWVRDGEVTRRRQLPAPAVNGRATATSKPDKE
jgi:hypothetical protein